MYRHIGEELEKQEQIINELCEWCEILLTELSLYRETAAEEERLERIRISMATWSPEAYPQGWKEVTE